jgi:hypothetical protein
MMLRYSAGRASSPAGRLAEVLSEPPADPLTPEWLAVPSDCAVALITSVQPVDIPVRSFFEGYTPRVGS